MRYQYVLIDLIGIPIDPGPEPVYNADGDPQPWSEDLLAGNTNQSSDPDPERPADLAFDSSSKSESLPSCNDSPQSWNSEHRTADPPLGKPSEYAAIPSPEGVQITQKPRHVEDHSAALKHRPAGDGYNDSPGVKSNELPSHPKSNKGQTPLRSCLKPVKKTTNKVESESSLDVADPPLYLDAVSATIPTPASPCIPSTESAAVPKSKEKVQALHSCLKKPKNTGNQVSFTSHNRMKFYKPTSKLTSSSSSLGETMVKMKEGYSTWQYQLIRHHNLMQVLDIERGEILDHRTDVHPLKLMKMMSEMSARGNTRGRKSRNIENTAHEDSAPPHYWPLTTACSYEQSSLDDNRSRNIAQKDVKWEVPQYSSDRFDSEMTGLSCLKDNQSASKSHLLENNVLADSRLADVALNIETMTKEVNQSKLSDHDEVSVIPDAAAFIEYKSKAIIETPDTSALRVVKMNFNIRTNNNDPTRKTNIRVINVGHHMHRSVVDEERGASKVKETPLLSRATSLSKNTRENVGLSMQIPLSKSFYHQESGDTSDQEEILSNSADGKTYKERSRSNDAPVEQAAPDAIASSPIILQQNSKTYKHQPRSNDAIVPSPIILQRDIDTHLEQDGLHQCRDVEKNRSVSVAETEKAGEMKVLVPAGDQPPSSRSNPSRHCTSLMETINLKEASSVFPTETQRKPKHEPKSRREDENDKRAMSAVSDRRKSREKRPKRENSHHQQDTKLLSDVRGLRMHQKSDGITSSLDTGKPGNIRTLANNDPTRALTNSSTSTLLSASQSAPKRQHFRKIPERPINGKTSDNQFSKSYASTNHCSRKTSGTAKFWRTTADDTISETKTKPKRRDNDFIVHYPENPSQKLPVDGKQSETKCHNAKTNRKRRKTKSKDGYLSGANDQRTETSCNEDDKTIEDGNSFKKGDKRDRKEIRDETARIDKTTNEKDDNAAHRSNGAGKRQKNRSITRNVKKAWEQTVSDGTNSESIASKPCDNTPFHGGTITREAVRNRFKAREYTAECEKDGVKAVRIIAKMLNSGKDPFEKAAKENDKRSTGQGNKCQDSHHVATDKTGRQTFQKQKPWKVRRLFTSICDKVKRIGKQQTTESATADIFPLADIPSRSCLKKVDTEGTKERMNVQFAAENKIRLYSISKKIPCVKSSLGESAVKMKETCEHVQIGCMGKGSKLLWRGKLAKTRGAARKQARK